MHKIQAIRINESLFIKLLYWGKNEIFRKILSNYSSIFQLLILNLSMVYRESNGGNICRPLASYNFGFCNSNKTKKK